MAVYGEQFLSKAIDSGNTQAFVQFGVKRSDFPTRVLQQACDFVIKYAAENNGRAPSYATFVAANPDVTYIPEVTDSFEYLAGKLKDSAARREFEALIEGRRDDSGRPLEDESEFVRRYREADSLEDFANWLTKEVERIKMESRTSVRIFTNVSTETERFLSEYRARKAGTSFRIWKSKFPTINERIGGYIGGNTYAWYARSGRGKSVLVMEDGAIEPAFQGATVLVWPLEMSEYEWLARAYTSISARLGLLNANIDGRDYAAGFDNRALLMGKLPEEFEEQLEGFLATINEHIPGEIIIRAADSEGFTERGIAQLESDIIETGADVVVIDPIYLMDFEANTSRVAGGDVAATSVKLKRLAGRTKAVIHVVTQAEEDSAEKGEDGLRDLKPPKRAEIKKSKAILEDAATVFGIDTLAHEGRGVIELGKGRNGGEDTRIEIVYLPNYGIVQEIDTAGQAEQFANVSGL